MSPSHIRIPPPSTPFHESMSTPGHRDSHVYMTPQQSPALGFGTPPMLHDNNWGRNTRESTRSSRSVHSVSPALGHRQLHDHAGSHHQHHHHHHHHHHHSLPSPPQQEHSFTTMPSEFHDRTNPPLSPPASDGLMSPMNHAHDFQDKIPMDPNLPTMWMTNPFGMKTDGDDMSLSMQDHSVTASPPPLFIEDILRADDSHGVQGMGNGFMDDHDFQEHGLSRPSSMKRPQDELSSVGLGGPFHPGATNASGINRVRKKRHLTEPSEANFHCTKCGKYFSRIWNYNAHLETHDPHRPRPHVCLVDDCKKAFVRRTDLTRHQQCVHAKDKKFRCELCNNMFARKDTLRRHEDDGCPKRVDIASRGSKSKPIAWNSQALGFYSAMQRRDEVFPNMIAYDPQMRPSHYDNGISSHLPPLSDIVPKTPSVLWG